MCAAAVFAIDKARRHMWTVFHDAPQRLPLPDGQSTLDGWVIVSSQATPLTACAQAALVHAVA
eukprot:100473-Chlamydomonas_euryale.AAC.1